MANTRTRTRKTETADDGQEGFFDPMATGAGATHGAAGTGEEDDFEGEQLHSPDPDGDGSVDEEPQEATNPLERTVAGMTEGTQAAQAEIADYLRRKANLLEEMATVRDDIKELDKEYKNRGWDMKAMALLVKIDNLTDAQKKARIEQNGINATYAHAAGIDEDLL